MPLIRITQFADFPFSNSSELKSVLQIANGLEISVLKVMFETFLAAQWLRLCTFTAGEEGSIPGWVTKIPCTVRCSQKKKKSGAWHPEECIFLGHKAASPLVVMSGSQLGIQIQGRLGLPWTAQKTSLRDLDSVGSSEDLKQKKKIHPQPFLQKLVCF